MADQRTAALVTSLIVSLSTLGVGGLFSLLWKALSSGFSEMKDHLNRQDQELGSLGQRVAKIEGKIGG